MGYFEDICQRLFGTSAADKKQTVAVNSLLVRSEKFLSDFESWKTSEQARQILDAIWQSFFWQKKGVDKQPVLLVLESKHSNGFALSYKEEYGRRNFQYLFDLLAEQVKRLGYRPVVSRRTIQDAGAFVETKEMHYLKPKPGFVEPIDQAFGNIQIEYIEENDRPVRIKFRANTYPDRKYKEARSFEELAELVLSQSSIN